VPHPGDPDIGGVAPSAGNDLETRDVVRRTTRHRPCRGRFGPCFRGNQLDLTETLDELAVGHGTPGRPSRTARHSIGELDLGRGNVEMGRGKGEDDGPSGGPRRPQVLGGVGIERLPNVPMSQGQTSVSPIVSSTAESGRRSSSATTSESAVRVPWPTSTFPVNARAFPSSPKWIQAPPCGGPPAPHPEGLGRCGGSTTTTPFPNRSK